MFVAVYSYGTLSPCGGITLKLSIDITSSNLKCLLFIVRTDTFSAAAARAHEFQTTPDKSLFLHGIVILHLINC